MRGFSALAALTLCVPAMAMTIDDLNPGTTVHGPKLPVKEMKGKVTFVIYWGTK